MSVEKKEYSIFEIVANLTIACFISGLIIACVYFVTAPVSARNEVILKEQAMKELVSEATSFKEIKNEKDCYEAKKGNKTIAYVYQSESKGYGGVIKLMVAVDSKDTVIGYKILSHNETPGLGDKVAKSPFKDQFKGKTIETLAVVKNPSDKKDVQAITGATISSRAVTKGVKIAVDEVNDYIGGK
ncbi:RnfABCDGE type electron transport complex subunit G [Romboutsia sp.]|uniref:RnfABCDGE type electron transport complex subunit G n=1 Tax=Romboutsia sp. TaxID=1965302 RepID=UPI003F3CE6E6